MILHAKYFLLGLPTRCVRFMTDDGWYYDMEAFNFRGKATKDGHILTAVMGDITLVYDNSKDYVGLYFSEYNGMFVTDDELYAYENGLHEEQVIDGVTLHRNKVDYP